MKMPPALRSVGEIQVAADHDDQTEYDECWHCGSFRGEFRVLTSWRNTDSRHFRIWYKDPHSEEISQPVIVRAFCEFNAFRIFEPTYHVTNKPIELLAISAIAYVG